MPPHFHEGGDPKYGWWARWPSPEPSTRWLREQQALLHQATWLPSDLVAPGTRTGHNLVFTGQCFIFHMVFLVSASVTKGPPNVKMLRYNTPWWKRCISHFSSFISFLSHSNQETASAFCLTHLYGAAPSVEEGGDLFRTFLLSNTLTLQQSIFILALSRRLLF